MKLSFNLGKNELIMELLLDTFPSFVNHCFIYRKVFILEIIVNFNTAYYSGGIIHEYF